MNFDKILFEFYTFDMNFNDFIKILLLDRNNSPSISDWKMYISKWLSHVPNFKHAIIDYLDNSTDSGIQTLTIDYTELSGQSQTIRKLALYFNL